MKKPLAVLAAVIAVPLLAFGVIFLIAAVGRPGRILVAAVLLGIGSLFLLWSVLTLRREAEISPEALATGIVDLARTLGGEVTVAQVQAQFHIPNQMAFGALEKMCGHGECQRDQRADHDVYVFKSVMPAKVIKRCAYCGSTFPVKSTMRDCPNCGATLEVVKE
jgi:hypothetical protein